MAYLINTQTNEKQYLLSHHTFGRRDELVDTCIGKPEVSKIHAVIEWAGQEWHIRSFGRNGTWVNGHRLKPTENHVLKVGQTVHFSDPRQNGWLIENLTPPCDLLVGLNEQSNTQSLSHYHLLPSDEEPLVALFFCSIRRSWVLEHRSTFAGADNEDSIILVDTNDTVEFADYQWRLFLIDNEPQTVDMSEQPSNVNHCAFNFDVSLDEEHVQLCLEHKGQPIDLGERSHHYLLLHLARIKAQHAKDGIDGKNQGWIHNDQLERELGIDNSHINIQIFRARKQIAHAIPNMNGLADLLERRRGAVRFNCSRATITKGEDCESICS